MDADGTTLNPVLFKMQLGQEAMDIALREQGLIPTENLRCLVRDRMKSNSWKFVQSCVQEVAALLYATN